MGKTILQRLEIPNIHTKLIKDYYLIIYDLSYCKLVGIPFDIYITKIVKEYNYYKLYIDEKSINLVEQIDTYFNELIDNYTAIIKNDNHNNKYIKFNNNSSNIIGKKLSQIKHNKLAINIIKIKKTTLYCCPIVYLL
mgnify:CR=1 FL=1|jgi:hypothetical protein